MKLPVVPSIVVGLAVAAMLALGFWQLGRADEKQAQISRHAQNMALPEIALPRFPVGDDNLFRRARGMCIDAGGWENEAGRTADGKLGFRVIGRCRTGIEGPGFPIELGVATEPDYVPTWSGGEVSGVLTQAPDGQSILSRALGKGAPRELMLVLDRAPQGLGTSRAPDPSSAPNNHLSYAVQWFAFAGFAVLIYFLALRHRQRGRKDAPAPPQ